MCGGPLEYISYEFVPASPAVSCMSGSEVNKKKRKEKAIQKVVVLKSLWQEVGAVHAWNTRPTSTRKNSSDCKDAFLLGC